MISFEGRHVGEVSGKPYTFVGTAEFADLLVRWQAELFDAGVSLGQHSGVINDVPAGSKSEAVALRGVGQFIDSKFER